MRGEGPRMAEWVLQDTDPAAVGLILDRSKQLCSSGCRLFYQRINIVDVDEDVDGCTSNQLRTAKIDLWKFIRKHDRCVTYSKFGMLDFCRRSALTASPLALQMLFCKIQWPELRP